MANGIHGAMNAVEAAGAYAIRNSAGEQDNGYELRACDHSVLPCGDPSDRDIAALGAFVRHIRTKAPTPPISPPSLPVFVPAPLNRRISCRRGSRCVRPPRLSGGR